MQRAAGTRPRLSCCGGLRWCALFISFLLFLKILFFCSFLARGRHQAALGLLRRLALVRAVPLGLLCMTAPACS
jgi:hypothetical protein